jgi:hypothetical protein
MSTDSVLDLAGARVAVRPDDRWLLASVHLSPVSGPL